MDNTGRTQSKDFRRIVFGFASAEKEGAQAPNLLTDGYFDIHRVSQEALHSKDFLILGYKGAGKSAVSERLRLMHEADSQVFLTSINLEDFPYATFSTIVQGAIAPEAKYPSAWSWLLLIYLLSSFEKDQLITHPDKEAFEQTMKALNAMGLTPITGVQNLVRSTTKKSLKLSVPKFIERTWEKTESDPDIQAYVEGLKNLVTGFRTESRHLLIIDGLDEIVTSETSQWSSLGALVFEVNRLNSLFSQYLVPAKILLLCRTDIFELIAGANKNKIRQDSCVDLNWYADPKAPGESLLVKIANLRATLAFGERTDIFNEIIPRRFYGAKARSRRNPTGKSTVKILLDTTRHTPRDFLQLLKYIQSCCAGPGVTIDNIKSGMRKYSIEYFLPEMVDELEGYCSATEAKAFFQLVGSLRSREFTARQLYDLAEKEQSILTKERIDIILRTLFECSAVGNVQTKEDGTHFLTYRFRNRHVTFNIRETLLLHRGLWQALNLPMDPRWDDDGPTTEDGSEPTTTNNKGERLA